MPNAALAIEKYITAKDGNRPDLLRQSFVSNATLEMIVQTDAISFPSSATGREAIAEMLVRTFGATYENVYTFCIGSPPSSDATEHTNPWLVGMSTKATGEVRVGCGLYNWQFQPESGLIESLRITIEHMHIYPAHQLTNVMDWLQGLPYPWCQAAEALRDVPQLADLKPVIDYLKE